jgi:hypothetical protein
MHTKTRAAVLVAMAFLSAGCAVQRAVVANDTQQKMVGLTKEELLACMGPPANRMAEGATEVWSYNSGDGHTATVASVSSMTNANASGTQVGNTAFASGMASSSGVGSAVTTRRSCTVNVNIVEGRVSRVNYTGPTGGLLTQGEQCAFAVQNCAR